jgi:hypothetical protein
MQIHRICLAAQLIIMTATGKTKLLGILCQLGLVILDLIMAAPTAADYEF